MPFAPSILEEWADRYISDTIKTLSPHMMIGFNSTELARLHLRAALHPYDYTMRPQMVSSVNSPDYYDLLLKYALLTNEGGFLNTSFNIHGMPIVMSPLDAISSFAESGLQTLALEDYIITKRLYLH